MANQGSGFFGNASRVANQLSSALLLLLVALLFSVLFGLALLIVMTVSSVYLAYHYPRSAFGVCVIVCVYAKGSAIWKWCKAGLGTQNEQQAGTAKAEAEARRRELWERAQHEREAREREVREEKLRERDARKKKAHEEAQAREKKQRRAEQARQWQARWEYLRQQHHQSRQRKEQWGFAGDQESWEAHQQQQGSPEPTKVQLRFATWRKHCRSLLQHPDTMTVLPQPPRTPCTKGNCTAQMRYVNTCTHELQALYQDAGLGQEDLKKERNFWHPDRWCRVPESCRDETVGMATEIFQVLQPLCRK